MLLGGVEVEVEGLVPDGVGAVVHVAGPLRGVGGAGDTQHHVRIRRVHWGRGGKRNTFRPVL